MYNANVDIGPHHTQKDKAMALIRKARNHLIHVNVRLDEIEKFVNELDVSQEINIENKNGHVAHPSRADYNPVHEGPFPPRKQEDKTTG